MNIIKKFIKINITKNLYLMLIYSRKDKLVAQSVSNKN